MDLMVLRRSLMNYKWKLSLLPAEYQQIEYIKTPSNPNQYNQNSWKAFICTNISNNDISKIVTKYEIISFTGTQKPMIFASHTAGNTSPAAPYITVTGNTSARGLNISPTISSPYDGKIEIYTVTYPGPRSNYLRIGGWDDTQWTAEGAYYFIDIYNNNTELIAQFIPCYRKSDNKVGMYDLIGETFYGSDGENDFIAGPNI